VIIGRHSGTSWQKVACAGPRPRPCQE